MNSKTLIPLFIFILFINIESSGQRFNMGLVLGLNNSQINGDGTKGYHKLGLTAGTKTSYTLNKAKEITLELLYSQRGSRNFSPNNPFNLNLEYIEAPLLFTSKYLYNLRKAYHKYWFSGGLSYGRLINNTKTINRLEKALDQIKYNDISFILGLGYMVTKEIGGSIRFTRSITKLSEKFDLINNGLSVYFLSARIEFKI